MIGELSALGCSVAWAIIATVMRVLSDRINPLLVSALRCSFGAITLAMLIALLGRTEGLANVPLGAVAAIVASGFLGQGLGDAFFVWSMKSIGASRALPVSSINPLLTLVLAAIFLGEQITWIGVAGTFLVVGGIGLLAFPYGRLSQLGQMLGTSDRRGLLLSLAAAVCWAISTVILTAGLAGADLLAVNLMRMTCASILLFGLEALHSGGKISLRLSRRSLAIFAMTGALSALSSIMYLTSIYYVGAAKTATLTSTAPLFGLPLSLFLLRERINSRIAVGTALTVLGIWLVLWR